MARGGGGGGGRRGNATTAPAESPSPGMPANFSFESFSINLRTNTPFSAKATVPADGAGTWYLYVRSRGTAQSSFKVSINDKPAPETFGNAPAFKNAGPFDLQPGPIKVTLNQIAPGSSFDVLVLSKNKDFKETDLLPLQYPEDLILLKDYKTVRPDGVKFGDLNGDGKTDFVVLTRDYSTYAYDNSGKELWHWDSPTDGSVQRQEFEAPGVVWDFDHDGKAEVCAWRMIDNKEYIVMLDGITGDIKHKVEWPTPPMPHVYNNFRMAIAKLHDGYPDSLIVYTDPGPNGPVSLNGYVPYLKILWSYAHPELKDYHGHYIYPVDINGDGIDEVYISHVMLDHNGKEIWNNYATFPDNHDHIDSARFLDLNGDGKLDLITGQSDVGTVLYEATTGKLIWSRLANHNQKIEAGFYRTDAKIKDPTKPQIVANSRFYAPGLSATLRWYDIAGNRIDMWPNAPIPGNPNFVKGDFRGDGKPQLFWQRFLINPDGTGTLAFPDEVFHMFDFMGAGNDQVVTVNAMGNVRIYGFKNAQQKPPNRDPLYLAHNVANHTHY